MRIVLFLLTNLAVILVASVVLSLLGVESVLQENGVDLNLTSLLIFSAVFGMAGSLVSLMISKWMALRTTGAKIIEEPRGQGEQWLVETVRQQASAAGIGMPAVAIFESATPNAFATGARRDSALVAVSTGLLQGMSRDEIEAVLGHEVSHVANGDMITLTLIQGVVNTFVIFFSRIVGHVVDRTVFKTERGYGMGYYITSIAAQLLFGMLASVIVYWFSRRREFRADAGGARLAGADKMIGALERLKRGTGGEPLPEALSAFGISNAGKRQIAALFSTHPSLDDRIAALRANAGL